jgi:hypothetical protein
MAPELAGKIARMALAAIHREYPCHLLHLVRSDADVRRPRELTPAFWGSFDWHSAVHGHWCLARLARLYPTASFAAPARVALARSLTPENLAGELAYLEPRPGFERPYGLAWLLQLAAELREWDDGDARGWSAALAPLESLAAQRLSAWLPKLHRPIRSGEHSQTAFAMGLALDWARAAGDGAFALLMRERARAYHAGDIAAPIDYEPSGHDFLSPALGEADLMRRVLAPDEFEAWLDRFLPDLDGERTRCWLTPVASPDPSDGKLAHLDGLNLSRAWMLDGVASALRVDHAARDALVSAARRHGESGLASLGGDHYEGSHWLGSFAAYWLTRRGVAPVHDGRAPSG